MKVFLSHSSKDKGFVEALAFCLRPGTYELDSETFDLGLVNSDVILRSLERCDMFCLLLFSNTLSSPYVNFEMLFGIDFLAQGILSRILILCIDEVSFERVSENERYFNIMRRNLEPESAARLIQGRLISAAQLHSFHHHPFIGREDEIAELDKQVIDHERPASKALYLSGHFGSGRRTIAQNFYKSYFPQVNQVFPTINIDEFTGWKNYIE